MPDTRQQARVLNDATLRAGCFSLTPATVAASVLLSGKPYSTTVPDTTRPFDGSIFVARYFDWEAAAERAGISPADLAAIRRRVERDYPSEMLREMHLEAICKAIGAGERTVADALKPPTNKLPPITDLRLGG